MPKHLLKYSARTMSELKLNMMMSLDGFAAGPEQSEENPFGIGGMQLSEWLFPLRVFRE